MTLNDSEQTFRLQRLELITKVSINNAQTTFCQYNHVLQRLWDITNYC